MTRIKAAGDLEQGDRMVKPTGEVKEVLTATNVGALMAITFEGEDYVLYAPHERTFQVKDYRYGMAS